MTKNMLWGLACIALAGCAGGETTGVEANELGITDVTVERFPVDAGQMLVLHGLAADGAEIGKASLLAGRVLYVSEEAPDGTWVDRGSELTVAVGGESWRDRAPGLGAHLVNEPKSPALQTFVRIHAVAAALEEAAGITFRAKQARDPELAYALAGCDGVAGLFKNTINLLSCCITFSGSTIYSTTVRANYNNLGVRSVGTPCSGDNNYYGACGGHVDINDSSSSTGTVVFWPANNYDECGYDSERGTSGGTFYPWKFTDYSEGEMAGLYSPSCTCTQCVAGVPKDDSGNDCSHY